MKKIYFITVLIICATLLGCSKNETVSSDDTVLSDDTPEDVNNISFLDDFKLMESLFANTNAEVFSILKSKKWVQIDYYQDTEDTCLYVAEYKSPGGLKTIWLNFRYSGESLYSKSVAIRYSNSVTSFCEGPSLLPLCEYLDSRFTIRQRGHMQSDYCYDFIWYGTPDEDIRNYNSMISSINNLDESIRKWGIVWYYKETINDRTTTHSIRILREDNLKEIELY